MRSSVRSAVEALVRGGALLADNGQLRAASALDATLKRVNDGGWIERLKTPRTMLSPWPGMRGAYICGPVGTGKTMLMDMAFERSEVPKRRVHWHAWMIEVHSRLHDARGSSNKLRVLGQEMAAETQLLCFDELAVHDVADALILREIFKTMFDAGVTVLATSNRRPRELYENGINRDLFLPFVDLIEDKCELLDMRSQGSSMVPEPVAELSTSVMMDYRTLRGGGEGGASSNWHADRAAFEVSLQEAAASGPSNGGLQIAKVQVAFGRSFQILATSKEDDVEGVACGSFAELCGRPAGAADYLALAERFETLYLYEIPQFTAAKSDEARRFVTLVDTLYESSCGLVASADCGLDDLLAFTPEDSHAPPSVSVVDEGGSSGRSTTMIGEAEWSATGLIGASLGQLAGAQDLQFAWARTHSRLLELTSPTWADRERAERRKRRALLKKQEGASS